MKALRTINIAVIALGLVLPNLSRAQYTDLLSLADPPTFGAAVSPIFTGVGSQTTAGFVVNGTIANGDLIYGVIASSQDWSSQFLAGYSFGLLMNTAAPNPDAPITLEFLDSSDVSIDIWSSSTGTTASNGYINFGTTPSSAGTGIYTDVKSFYITWANVSNETINTTISTIAVVPEPSTYALLAMSGLAFGGYVIRRRRRA